MPKKSKSKKKDDPYGLAIPSGLFVGMGLGFLLGDFVGWMFVGLGCGFFLMLLLKLLKK